MIQVQNLTKSYNYKGKKTVVLDDVSFTIQSGESVAIVGHNGAGKSTLMRLIGGIDKPDSGHIHTDSTISWPVGLMHGFQGSLTARQNVEVISIIHGAGSRKEVRDRIKQVEQNSEIGAAFDRPMKTYSDGMRARVAFMMSMAFDYDYYLIDEVSGAGDAAFREKCKKLLLEKRATSNFIMVDHNLFSLSRYCDKGILVHDKKVVVFDNIEDAIAEHKRLQGVPQKRGKRNRPASYDIQYSGDNGDKNNTDSNHNLKRQDERSAKRQAHRSEKQKLRDQFKAQRQSIRDEKIRSRQQAKEHHKENKRSA